MGKIIKMKDLLEKEGIELGKVYTDKTMPPFKVKEGNIGITTKKGKSIELTHKKSGKEIVVQNTPSILKKYKKLGYLISMPEEKLSEMKVNKGKVDKTYKSVLNHMRKVIKKLNDDEMYEVTTKLKQWFNKNIM